jgi:hypothetical protein
MEQKGTAPSPYHVGDALSPRLATYR